MRTREYRVWFSINVELPEHEDPQQAYRAAIFNLMHDKPQPGYGRTVYLKQHLEEVVWYRNHNAPIRRWDKWGREKRVGTDISEDILYWRRERAKQAREEAEKLKQQIQESTPGIAP